MTKDQQILKEFTEFNEKRETKTAKGNLESVGEDTGTVLRCSLKEDEIKELKNSETSVSSKREL